MFSGIVECSGLLDLVDDIRGLAIEHCTKTALKRCEIGYCKWIQQAGLNGEYQGHLVGEAQGRVLLLTEYRSNARPSGELITHARVRHPAEACEGLKLKELRVIEAQRLGSFAQCVRLCLAADPADARADIDRRLLPFMSSSSC